MGVGSQKKGQKASRASWRERGNTKHRKKILHKAAEVVVSSSMGYGVGIIPKDSHAEQPSV